MKKRQFLVGLGMIFLVSGIVFLGLAKDGMAAEKNKYEKITYPEVDSLFFEPKTADIPAKKQMNDYLNRRLAELKNEKRLKNYLPKMTPFFLNYKKDTTDSGSITYQIEEKTIATTLKLNRQLETKQQTIEVTTVSTKTGEPLMLHELFNDEVAGFQEIKTKLTEKIAGSARLSDNQKKEIMEQVNKTIFENTTHYSLSNNEIIFKFPTNQGIETIGFAKNQLRRQLKSDYMTETLNQQVAEEIQQEEAIRAQKEAERKAEEERQRVIENQKVILPSSGKVIALTFDDGPEPAVTPRILEMLAKYNARATFFILGKNAAAYPNLVLQEINAGHEIGNHSWSHPDLTALPKDKALNQVSQTNQTIKELTGCTVNLLRPPYGALTNTLSNEIKMPIIQWSVDTMDWKSKNATAVYQETMKNAQNGSIVLMHDIHPTTADGLERILQELTAQGYKFVTVSELLGTPMQPGLQYYSRGSVR